MKIGQLLKVICAALMKNQPPLTDQLQAVIVAFWRSVVKNQSID